MNQRIVLALLLISAAISVFGCDRRESLVRTYAAPKDIPAPPVSMDAAGAMAASTDIASATSATDSGPPEISWTLPAGWKQLPGSSMRFATILVDPADPKIELTVVPLGAEAAGTLGNVTRWAGQLKLPTVSEADLPKFVTQTQVSGEPSQIVDMTGSAETGNPALRLLAAIVPHAGSTWFFTLKAPAPLVASQKTNFESLIHSIQFRATTGMPAKALVPPTAPPSEASAAGPAGQRFKIESFQTPPGWTEQPGSNDMRVTSFRVGTGADSAEVIISRIRQGQSGSLVSNFNRWRGQVGLEPITTESDGAMQYGSVAGQPGMFVVYTGPAVDGAAAKQVSVAMTILGGDDWFIKMLGPQTVVSAQQDAFRQFVNSLKFSPESK